MKRILLPAVAACMLTFAGTEASARRIHTFDSTDPATKAYCQANPDRCETRINWGTSIGYTVGTFVMMSLFVASFKAIGSKVKKTLQ